MVNKRSARGRHNVETDKAFFISLFFSLFLYCRIQNKSIYHNLEINELLRKSNIFLLRAKIRNQFEGNSLKEWLANWVVQEVEEKRTTSTFYLLFTSSCYIRLVLCYLVLKKITFSWFLPPFKENGFNMRIYSVLFSSVLSPDINAQGIGTTRGFIIRIKL